MHFTQPTLLLASVAGLVHALDTKCKPDEIKLPDPRLKHIPERLTKYSCLDKAFPLDQRSYASADRICGTDPFCTHFINQVEMSDELSEWLGIPVGANQLDPDFEPPLHKSREDCRKAHREPCACKEQLDDSCCDEIEICWLKNKKHEYEKNIKFLKEQYEKVRC